MRTLLGGPKVSVIVPTYNVQDYIGGALSSVLSQDFNSFEVIVVDDGSSDQTREVVRDFVSRDPRIRLVTLSGNSGRPSVARNVGISEALGDYIAFLDGDDVWMRSKLRRQVGVLERHEELALVHSYMWVFTERSVLLGLVYLPNPFRKRGGIDRLVVQNVIQCSSVMVRSEVLEGLHGFDQRPELRSIEDYELWVRIAQKYEIGYLSEIQGLYRKRSGSTSDQEDLLKKLFFLDSVSVTQAAENRPRLMAQIIRKLYGFPIAVLFHGIDAPLRKWAGRLPRVF